MWLSIMPTNGGEGGAERISEAEHAVMEALWKRSPLTAAEVCSTVCEERGWSIPTVKTLLSRLVAKGALGYRARRAPVSLHPADCTAANMSASNPSRLVERLFGGRAAPLFAHLAESESLTDEDIAEIEPC